MALFFNPFITISCIFLLLRDPCQVQGQIHFQEDDSSAITPTRNVVLNYCSNENGQSKFWTVPSNLITENKTETFM